MVLRGWQGYQVPLWYAGRRNRKGNKKPNRTKRRKGNRIIKITNQSDGNRVQGILNYCTEGLMPSREA